MREKRSVVTLIKRAFFLSTKSRSTAPRRGKNMRRLSIGTQVMLMYAPSRNHSYNKINNKDRARYHGKGVCLYESVLDTTDQVSQTLKKRSDTIYHTVYDLL